MISNMLRRTEYTIPGLSIERAHHCRRGINICRLLCQFIFNNCQMKIIKTARILPATMVRKNIYKKQIADGYE